LTSGASLRQISNPVSLSLLSFQSIFIWLDDKVVRRKLVGMAEAFAPQLIEAWPSWGEEKLEIKIWSSLVPFSLWAM